MDLLHYPVDLIEAVCHAIGKERRKEGETAFPSIGVLEERCATMMEERRTQAESKRASEEITKWRAHWERERAEDIANGIKRGDAITERDAALSWNSQKSNATAPWLRLRMSEVEYEASVDYKRSLGAKMKEQIAKGEI